MAGRVSQNASFSLAIDDLSTGRAPAVLPGARRIDPVCRAIAWGAMLSGSLLPTILSPFTGNAGPCSIALGQAVVLTIMAVIASRSHRLRALSGFLFTIAILRLGWSVVAPALSDWPPIQVLMANLDWGPKIFVSRLLNVAGALLLLATLIGRGFNRDELFLRIGQLNAPVKPERILWFRSHVRWWHLAPLIIVTFAVAMAAFLFTTLRPNFWQLSQHWQLLPWALATAALNAANEEFQYRSVPLAHLRDVVPLREAVWLTEIFFGMSHYFGQPSGWLGVMMATVAGWIWAKSMVETRGVGWAFTIHMVQDVVIFYFLAMSMKS